jgi:hypothetical protein
MGVFPDEEKLSASLALGPLTPRERARFQFLRIHHTYGTLTPEETEEFWPLEHRFHELGVLENG